MTQLQNMLETKRESSAAWSLNSEQGGIAAILIGLLATIAVLGILIFYVFGQIVSPNEIGVRRNYFTIPGLLKEGYEDEGLLPGLHLRIPGISTIQLLPRDFQFVHLNDEEASGELDLENLEIPTTDGSKVKTDLTLVVRYYEAPETVEPASESIQIEEGEAENVPFITYTQRSHGGPKQLVNSLGTSLLNQLRVFATKSEQHLKQNLSRLSTTDYYNPTLREHAALDAFEAINSDVAPDGIELWGVLIRRYVYSEKAIDDQIFAKNLQEQTERLNAAERALEEARARTEETEARWDAEIRDLLVKGEQEKAIILSEAERYEIEQRSVGDRMVTEAQANVDKAKNTVLAETPGASVFVARQMTPLLKTLQGGVVTDIDPFDVDAWVKKLVAEIENMSRGAFRHAQ